MIVGDKRQEIYNFRGSNTQYFLYPEKYFNRGTFERKFHKNSYRITMQMANFINMIYKEEVITS